MKVFGIISGLAAILAPVSGAAEVVFDFPENAGAEYETFEAAATYQLPVGPFANGGIATEATEGSLVQQVWQTKIENTKTIELLAPLRGQLEQAGYAILFECETRNCGGFDFRFETDVVAEPQMHVDLGDFRFLSAKKTTATGDEFVSLLVSRSPERGYIQVTKVGKSFETDIGFAKSTKQNFSDVMVEEDVTTLAQRLTTTGAAVLDGLLFANGSANLADGEPESLEALARFLTDNADVTVILVGHTDAVGALSGNVSLSKRRADAVKNELIDTFGIAPARLASDGIGFLAPQASNQTEEGRQKNRRVEVVITSTR